MSMQVRSIEFYVSEMNERIKSHITTNWRQLSEIDIPDEHIIATTP